MQRVQNPVNVAFSTLRRPRRGKHTKVERPWHTAHALSTRPTRCTSHLPHISGTASPEGNSWDIDTSGCWYIRRVCWPFGEKTVYVKIWRRHTLQPSWLPHTLHPSLAPNSGGQYSEASTPWWWATFQQGRRSSRTWRTRADNVALRACRFKSKSNVQRSRVSLSGSKNSRKNDKESTCVLFRTS